MEFAHVKLTIGGSAEFGWTISGPETFALREQIKSVGGKWVATTKTWVILAGSDVEPLWGHLRELSNGRVAAVTARATASKKPRKPRSSSVKTAEAKKKLVLEALDIKANTGRYYWVCCEECEVIDWELGHTSCKVHAIDYGLWKQTFRIMGVIYTGD